MQKFSDDTAIVACTREEGEDHYRNLVQDFVRWCCYKQLRVNTTKTKMMVLDFR